MKLFILVCLCVSLLYVFSLSDPIPENKAPNILELKSLTMAKGTLGKDGWYVWKKEVITKGIIYIVAYDKEDDIISWGRYLPPHLLIVACGGGRCGAGVQVLPEGDTLSSKDISIEQADQDAKKFLNELRESGLLDDKEI
jgi:hypothetical protein